MKDGIQKTTKLTRQKKTTYDRFMQRNVPYQGQKYKRIYMKCNKRLKQMSEDSTWKVEKIIGRELRDL